MLFGDDLLRGSLCGQPCCVCTCTKYTLTRCCRAQSGGSYSNSNTIILEELLGLLDGSVVFQQQRTVHQHWPGQVDSVVDDDDDDIDWGDGWVDLNDIRQVQGWWQGAEDDDEDDEDEDGLMH